MKTKDGTDYQQNYDLITKWMSAVFKGETLRVLGLDTGRIEDVFGFEPADIAVKTGRLDIIFRDEKGVYYHLEEQRNPVKADLYRSAAYHFSAGRQWGENIKDIILVSGNVQIDSAEVKTQSGHYYPTIIDLSARDGYKRLKEIQEAAQKEEFKDWLELVFLPLYGRETGYQRSKFVEKVLNFEIELNKKKKLPDILVAATLVMSNKFIDKKDLLAIWEEIKMLDILEIAQEKGFEQGKLFGLEQGKVLGLEQGKLFGIEQGKLFGIEQGKVLGLEQGKLFGLEEGKVLGLEQGKNLGMLKKSQTMIVDALFEKFEHAPGHIVQQIRAIDDNDVLNIIFRQIFRCNDIKEFEQALKQIMS
jgi:hypothetical protein